MIYSVLFVCTANICRSPMAMGLLRAKVAGEQEDWRIESAGTWSLEGNPAAANTRLVLQERNVRIDDHRSRMVTGDLLNQFNLILTMERGHKEALQIEFPDASDRIYMLSEMAGKRYDIQDPIGGDLDEFQMTSREIDEILDKGFTTIKRLASGRDQPMPRQ